MTNDRMHPAMDLAERDHLQQRIASLEQQLHERAQDTDVFAKLYFEALYNLPVGVVIYHFENLADPASLRIVMVNPASSRFVGMDLSPSQGQRIIDVFPLANEQVATLIDIYADVMRTGQKRDLGEMPFDIVASDGHSSISGVYTLQVFPLTNQHLCILFEDVTERKRAEATLLQTKLQEEVIRAQEAALAELSTPLLAVGDGVVVMPLVGTIDSKRALQVMERLLEGVSAANARAVILDITGIPIVDTQVANAFIRAA